MTTASERVAASSDLTTNPTVHERPSGKFVLTLGALIAIGPLTIDTYLPAFPSITTELETTSAAVQLTLTGTLIGMAAGQLLIGPISDAVGRRRPLVAGIAVHVLASLLCVVAPNILMLGVLRVLQGLGVAAATVVAMAMVRDVSSGIGAAKLMSRLMLVMGVAPVLAPTLGSQILRFTNWRGVFVALALLGLILIAVAVTSLPETLAPQRRRGGGVLSIVRTYGSLFTDRVFVGLVLVTGLSMGALFGYVAGSSFVFQDQYGLSEQQFGLAFGAGSIALIVGTQVNGLLLRWYQPRLILAAALVAGFASGVALLIVAATGVGGLVGLLIPIWGALGFTGLVLPNAPALALSRHGEKAGAAAALLGALQFAFGAVTAPLVGVLGVDALAMAWVVAGSLMLALLVLVVAVRPWSTQPSSGSDLVDARASAEPFVTESVVQVRPVAVSSRLHRGRRSWSPAGRRTAGRSSGSGHRPASRRARA
ncbi:MAG TPA: multidrug effflux MFS transporter [Kineosporiaceae bacterium]|nr:multidrug effflux MFS transporter [Kineosporiaceae bacterium]